MTITLKDYNRWYDNHTLHSLIAEITRNRETYVISKPRGLHFRMFKIHTPEHFKFLFSKLNCIYKGHNPYYNIYYSMMEYEYGIPSLPCILRDRKQLPDIIEWKRKHLNTATKYDLLIDLDAPSENLIPNCHKQAVALKKLLDSCNVEYELRFSGMGFHFIVPHNALNIDIKLKNFEDYVEILRLILNQLHIRYSYLDRGVCDSRRVAKIPFTLSVYKCKTSYVVIPFRTTDKFEDFKLSDAKIKKWFDMHLNLYYTNTVFNKGGTINKLIDEVKTWHKE